MGIGDEKTIKLWKKMNSWVYEGFDKTYKSLGIEFDKNYYESNTYLKGKKIVENGIYQGIFYKKKDNSICVDLSENGLDEKVLNQVRWNFCLHNSRYWDSNAKI